MQAGLLLGPVYNNLINLFYKEFSYHTDEGAKIGAEKDLTTQMPRLFLEILAVLILVIIINTLRQYCMRKKIKVGFFKKKTHWIVSLIFLEK